MTIPNEKTPYLRVQRTFPQDSQALSVEMSKAYIDIAQNMNKRSIGVFANVGSITGDTWYLSGGNSKQQSLRQVYPFTAAGSIPHGLIWSSVSFISPNSYGSYTDGTNWYGVIFSTQTAETGQVIFYVTPTDIVIVADGGAPPITSGQIILEWISVV